MNGRRRLVGLRMKFMPDLIVCTVEFFMQRGFRIVFVAFIEDIAFHFMIILSFADGRRSR